MSDVRMNGIGADIEKSPVQFTVKQNGETLGTLLISKGGLRWKKKRERRGKMVPWTDFAKLVDMLK